MTAGPIMPVFTEVNYVALWNVVTGDMQAVDGFKCLVVRGITYVDGVPSGEVEYHLTMGLSTLAAMATAASGGVASLLGLENSATD